MFVNFNSVTTIPAIPDWWFWLWPAIMYAEMHYRLKFLQGRLFKRQPEILFDVPHRIQTTRLPVVLIIKDAHWFPVTLKQVILKITSPFDDNLCVEQVFSENLKVDEPWFTREYSLEVAKYRNHQLSVNCTAILDCNGRIITIQNDNYAGLSQADFSVYVDSEPLPADSGWIWGDLHCHSQWTSDQVEFGVPLAVLPDLAKAMGLSFCGLVEHSYDLDDLPDSWTKNDPELRQWLAYRQAVQAINAKLNDFIVIPGEEVSVDNGLGRNVHLAVLNNSEFFPGSGDGLERSVGFASELTYQRVLERAESQALIFAAHPLCKPPLTQQIIARRGIWNLHDQFQRLNGWQILNGQEGKEFSASRNFWIKKLLSGNHSYIYAGNDSHGNFNRFRQVKIPLILMHENEQQIFGEFLTGVQTDLSAGLDHLVANLKNGAVIVSNGPFLNIKAIDSRQNRYAIGQTMPELPQSVEITALSTRHCGAIHSIRLYIGNFDRQVEEIKTVEVAGGIYRNIINLPVSNLPNSGYFRAEVETKKRKFALTNPIWFS